MILAFLFYVILILLLISLIFASSKIQIDIVDLRYAKASQINFLKQKPQTVKKIKFLIKIRVYIFEKIPIISVRIDEQKLKKLEKRKGMQKLQKKMQDRINLFESEIFENIGKWDKNIFKDIIETARKLKAKINNIKLKVNIGLEDVIATSFFVPVVSTAIAFFARNMKLGVSDNEYQVKPLYNMENCRNQINISLKCIIEVKMIHIINIMYIIKNQRKVSGNVRTSNRRSYDYSYE